MPNNEDWIWQYAIQVVGTDDIKSARNELDHLYKAAGRTMPEVKVNNANALRGGASLEKLMHGVDGYQDALKSVANTMHEVSNAGKKMSEEIQFGFGNFATDFTNEVRNIPSAIVSTGVGDTINTWKLELRATGEEIIGIMNEMSHLGDSVKESEPYSKLVKEGKELDKVHQKLEDRLNTIIAAHQMLGEYKLDRLAGNVELYKARLVTLRTVLKQVQEATNAGLGKDEEVKRIDAKIEELNIDLAQAVALEREYGQELKDLMNDSNADADYTEKIAQKWHDAQIEVTKLSTSISALEQRRDTIGVDPKAEEYARKLNGAIQETEKSIGGAYRATQRWIEQEGPVQLTSKYNTYMSEINQNEEKRIKNAEELKKLQEQGNATNIAEVERTRAEKQELLNQKYKEYLELKQRAAEEDANLAGSSTGGSLGLDASADNAKRLAEEMNDVGKITQLVNEHIQQMKLPEGRMSLQAKRLKRHIIDLETQIKTMELTSVPSTRFEKLEKTIASTEKYALQLQKTLDDYVASGVDTSSDKFQRLKRRIAETHQELARLRGERVDMLADGSAFASESDTKQYQNLVKSRDEAMTRLDETMAKDTEQHMMSIAKVFEKALKAGLTGFSGTAKKEFNAVKSAVKNIVSSVKNWHKEQRSITDQAKAMYNTFNSYWRMLKTRIKRKLVGAVFNDITGTIGEIARIEPRFNSAISGFIVSARTLGAQIIASFEPIASIVFPILSQFLDYLTQVTSQLAQFISRATGDTKFIKATKGQFDYAASLDKTTSSTKKATKAAKEYENTVMSFDQLHKLNGTNDESSLDEALGLDGVNLDHANDKVDAINELGERLWDALSKHDFAEAGRVMGDAVNMGFAWLSDKFGWEKNAEKFSGWLQNIIDAVNGFVEELDPEVIGKSIGDIINSGIMALYMITDPKNGIHFDVLGQRIGEALVAMFKEIKWNEAGKAFMGLIQGFLRGITGMLNAGQGLGKELGDSLSAFIGGAIEAIRPEDWGGFIASLANNLFGFLQRAFGDKDRAYELGAKIGGIINDALKDIDADTIAGGINAVATALVEAFNGLWDSGAIGNTLQKLGEVWKKIDKKTLIKAIAIALIPAMIGGVLGAIGGLIKALPKLGVKLIGKLFKGIGKLFKLGKKASGSTSGVVSFIDGLKSIGLKFLNATAFLAVVAEIGLVIREYAWVVQSIADIDIGENFTEKLKAVLVLAGTTTLVAAIITALTTGVSKSGIGAGGLLVGELLAGGFIAELWALSQVLDEYVSVVSHICELNIPEDYNTKLDKVLQLAVGSAVLVGIITAIGSVASGTVYGGLAMAAGELLAGGILLELYAMNEIIDGFVSTVQDIASLQINEAQYVTNIQAIEAAVLAFTNLMLSTGWTALFQLPGQMATALDLTLIDTAVQTVKEITAIELPDPDKIEEFGNTAQELFNLFSDDSGFLEGLWNGLKGITSNWGNSVDYEGIRKKFDIMLYMINGLAGLAQSGVTSEGLQGSWATAMSAVEQQTVTSMNNIVMVISNTLKQLQNLFNNTHLALSFGVAGYTNTQSINHYANGGIIGDGQLFFANEGRPELIGRENDSTVVVNNDQIISSVITGVRQGVIDAMSRYQDTNGNDGGDIVIRIDSEDIAKASLRGQRKINKRQNPLVSFA